LAELLHAIMVIIAILIVVLINLKGLLNAKPRGKIMWIYFTVVGISLFIGILLSIGKRPMSPNDVIKNFTKLLGIGEG